MVNSLIRNLKENKAKIAAVIVFCIIYTPLFAQEVKQQLAEPAPLYVNPLFLGLLVAQFFLLMLILVMADLVKTAAYYKVNKQNWKGSASKAKPLAMFLVLLLFSQSLIAQNPNQVNDPTFLMPILGLDAVVFYLMVFALLFELYVVWNLYGVYLDLFDRSEKNSDTEVIITDEAKSKQSIWEKLNASVSIEKEKDILLDHHYDGIRELDNNLPPWWKYGFYLSILFAIVYLIHFHFLKTGKMQLAEYEEQMDVAAKEIEEFRLLSANLVDENNVTILTDPVSMDAGKAIYMENCSACHGSLGEGGVGPNLTDEYWLHKGSIKDIFKTVKYGWPEKGMKAWKLDLGAKQIHQVSSFIISLKGSNPANPKEKQGDFYSEEDSLVSPLDSIQISDSSLNTKPDLTAIH
jgi:cytochrome c oxidase cbb3-type subunit 3